MLEIKDLTKKYDKNIIFENVNYIFEKGDIYGIIGKNGVGKTTLFECISKKSKYSGTIKLNENNNYNVSYVTSTPIVPEFLTTKEFLDFYLEKDSTNVLEELNIKIEDRNKLLKECSLGTKCKVQLYINLSENNELIILDEPFTNIDLSSSNKVKEKLKKLKENHIIILSTHNKDIMKNLCDKLLILENKKLNNIDKNNIEEHL